MKIESNKVQVTNGQETRWVAPNQLEKFAQRGYNPVNDEPKAALKPRKVKEVEEEQQPTEELSEPTTDSEE